MEPIIPLISSGTAGPLGVLHLPRLWLKALLSAHGRLAEGYKDIRPGFDYMVLEGLRISPDAARNFIFREKPTYLAFEQWVRSQPGVDVSSENIAKVNKEVSSRQKAPESRKKMLAQLELDDDGSLTTSVMLNSLDDWRELHVSLHDANFNGGELLKR